ncbi:MAG: radical SAM protein [Bacteroidales bacterium]|nr:radical SAM protein [Bacteroidales bacterium]
MIPDGISYILKKTIYKKIRISHIIAFIKYNNITKLINLINSFYERHTKKSTLKSKPYLINSELTNSCFLKCPFCPTGKENSRPNGFAEPALYEKIIKEIGKYVYLITFHGWGEPLLPKNLPYLIELSHRNRICTVVTTNGLLLNEEISKKLITSKLDVLYISLDGITEETYQKYRIGGKFDTVLNNIKKLVSLKKEMKSSNPFIEWQFIVFKHNEHEIFEAKKKAKELGVNNIVFLPAYTENPDFDPSDQKFRLPKNSPLSIRSDCKHLWSSLAFHWNGTIVPCCYDYKEEISYGTINHTNFNDTWNSAQFIKSRQIIINGCDNQSNNLPCYKCISHIDIQLNIVN